MFQAAFNRARASKKEGFRHLELVLLRTPWHVSSSFRDAVSTGAPLNLTGLSDPSERGLMWDLTKARAVRKVGHVLICVPKGASSSCRGQCDGRHGGPAQEPRQAQAPLSLQAGGDGGRLRSAPSEPRREPTSAGGMAGCCGVVLRN